MEHEPAPAADFAPDCAVANPFRRGGSALARPYSNLSSPRWIAYLISS